jgi:hypothetical protein
MSSVSVEIKIQRQKGASSATMQYTSRSIGAQQPQLRNILVVLKSDNWSVSLAFPTLIFHSSLFQPFQPNSS